MLIFYGTLVVVFNKPIKESNQNEMEINTQLTYYLVESLNGIETIKAFNAERETKTETELKFTKLLKTILKEILMMKELSYNELIAANGGGATLGSLLVAMGLGGLTGSFTGAQLGSAVAPGAGTVAGTLLGFV